ncbi:major facilitator superfamily domain-containing protein [Mycena vulgaris]|nr:major facilitator superfamily domain-containing protein [Mycena vulgaris]
MVSTPSHSICDEKRHEEAVKDPLHVEAAAERRLVRKLDICLLTCLVIAYLLCFIDPSNTGSLVAGLATEIRLGNWGFNIGTCLYYVVFIVCEIPAVMFVRRFGSRAVPLALLGFGTITIGTGFINTRGEFYAMKALLGMAESFVLPGNIYIITQFYGQSELSVRIGFFIFSAGYLSGAFGGLVASGFLRLAPIGPVHTWRHIFVSEGGITIGVGVLPFFFDSARALTAAVISGAGGIGSIVGSWSYFPTEAKTGYHIGNTLNVSLAVVVSAGIAALLLFGYMANIRKCEPSDGDADSSFRYNLSQAVTSPLGPNGWEATLKDSKISLQGGASSSGPSLDSERQSSWQMHQPRNPIAIVQTDYK